ncbi:carboxylate-amine ligase [Nakamurella leprariae]|uniref:Putative glutamate--cysteine ligase 2 n=1 Tax=Nakamurella leprariae TaxID=2803911 RepID=A0A939BZT0_9ACTN|nr:glutamate--cysteine ligase [Nakamurella leprariae]MBM9468490.1 glutamate--cysteine ligase [Nakamurella leprariae]
MSGSVRIGVEEEFHLVDPATGVLSPGSTGVLAGLPTGARFKPELMASAVETNSGVCGTLDGLRADVIASRRAVVEAADAIGLGVIGTGAAPLWSPEGIPVVHTERYEEMREDYRKLAEEQFICGLQVHIDCPDRDLGVRVMVRLQPWLPILLALSASSPYWQGRDTGYASYRTIAWRRWPTAGPVPCVRSAAEYDALVDALVASGVAHDDKMIYFDARPALAAPTLEIRICDSVPLVDDVVLLAGLARALVCRAVARETAEPGGVLPVPVELLEAARWRAARSGLTGVLLDPRTFRPVLAAEAVGLLLAEVRDDAERTGDAAELAELCAASLADGGSAARQRRAVARSEHSTRSVRAAVDLLRAETRATGRAGLGAGTGAMA